MKWLGRQGSGNVQDRRGMGGLAVGGGIGGIVVLILGLLMGQNPLEYLNPSPKAYQPDAKDDEKSQFVSVVLKDTEDVWNKIFSDNGGDYQEPVLVLFSGSDQSACGMPRRQPVRFIVLSIRKYTSTCLFTISFNNDLERQVILLWLM
jgi:uncharacterized protein